MADTAKKSGRERLLVKLGTFFVKNWQAGLVVWLAIVIAGGQVYTNVISREGFPPISFPLSFVSGAYIVDDAERVDEEVVKPVSDALSQLDTVKEVEASSDANFFTLAVEFEDSVTSEEGADLVRDAIESNQQVPEQAQFNISPIDPAGYLFEYNVLVHVYSTTGDSVGQIDQAAAAVAEHILEQDLVGQADPKVNVSTAIDPLTGQPGAVQQTFNRVGVERSDNSGLDFHNSTVIGVKGVEDADVIELSAAIREAIETVDTSSFGSGIGVVVGADFADDIEGQIEFLESNILTGLLAVSLISLLLISWRSSIITALFMTTVILSTVLVLFLIGYTLNTITLFALILSLGLFVDDATIVVEAIDVSKRQKKLSAKEVVAESIRKVGAASLSGTLTTVLVFAILATPTGILGEFIRLIPVTVVIALLLSFILSITVIPLLARFIVLRNREPSLITQKNPILKFEEWVSVVLERNILKLKDGGGKLTAGLAVFVSLAMIMFGNYLFAFKVDQNIFPPAKDSDFLGIDITYAPGTSVDEATAIAERIEGAANEVLGENAIAAIYGQQILANAQSAQLTVDLLPFTDREVKSPELVEQTQAAIDELGNLGAIAVATQIDNGPPSEQYPFGVRVFSDDPDVLRAATADISENLIGQELTATNGDTINILESRFLGVEDQILRLDGERYASVRFSFDNTNPTIVTMLSEERFGEIYDDETLAALSLDNEAISFDAGQEGDFQDSFATLILAIPIALALMYTLLAVQFRSFLQPFLILLAIPFTLFGVAAGLLLTSNAASFFALTGFIGLIGIAVNNTIMLTDYANQERRAGHGAIEAIARASRKRSRPLIATSITTVVALLPLALTDPFWEALAFTIIFGLLSSTFLVLISFPYYYLMLEWVKRRVSRIFRRQKAA